MAHAAEIDPNTGTVLRVIVVSNDYEPDVEQWCEQTYGGTWRQTSYNANIRKNYAGVGFAYDAQRDAFVPPKPYPSWVLNETTCQWRAPVAMPQDGKAYAWDEAAQNWVEA